MTREVLGQIRLQMGSGYEHGHTSAASLTLILQSQPEDEVQHSFEVVEI